MPTSVPKHFCIPYSMHNTITEPKISNLLTLILKKYIS